MTILLKIKIEIMIKGIAGSWENYDLGLWGWHSVILIRVSVS